MTGVSLVAAGRSIEPTINVPARRRIGRQGGVAQ
jgi:hypothetical protein